MSTGSYPVQSFLNSMEKPISSVIKPNSKLNWNANILSPNAVY